MATPALTELWKMTNRLGRPELDYVILGEGNTSARENDGSFWVTPSGAELLTVEREAFVLVDHARALALLDAPLITDEQLREALVATRVDGAKEPRPSVETAVHAVLLELPGVKYIGHTHPTWVNMVTCSNDFGETVAGRLFPDEVVMCGLAPLLVPYVDPGVPLAREVRSRSAAYLAKWGQAPKVVLMQNHGLVALGATALEVEQVTAMTVKAARVLVGSHAMGGPHFMPEVEVLRIHGRLDEHYRQRVIRENAGRS